MKNSSSSSTSSSSHTQTLSEEQFKEAILTRLSMKDTQLDSALKKFIQLEQRITPHQTSSSTSSSTSINQHEGNTYEDRKYQETINNIYGSILKELEQFLFQVEKEQLIYDAYQRDCDHYKVLFKSKEAEIKQVRQDIVEYKWKLKNEQQNKRNREEYNTLTKHINKHPRRSETEKAINEVKKELSAVEARAREITNEFETRTKQFQLVLHAINLLQEEITSDKKRKRPDSTDSSQKRHKTEGDGTVATTGITTTTSTSITGSAGSAGSPAAASASVPVPLVTVSAAGGGAGSGGSAPETGELNSDANHGDSDVEGAESEQSNTGGGGSGSGGGGGGREPSASEGGGGSGGGGDGAPESQQTGESVTVTEVEDNANVEVEDVYETVDVMEHF